MVGLIGNVFFIALFYLLADGFVVNSYEILLLRYINHNIVRTNESVFVVHCVKTVYFYFSQWMPCTRRACLTTLATVK